MLVHRGEVVSYGRHQFMFQGSGKDSFMLVEKFPYLPLNLRRGILM
jgi:hypothetical protein